MAWYGRVLGLVALLLLFPVVETASLQEALASIVPMAIGSPILGVPFALAFVAQVLLGRRHLHDAVLLAVASCAALVLALYLEMFAGDGVAAPSVAGTVILALVLTLLMSLGALTARRFAKSCRLMLQCDKGGGKTLDASAFCPHCGNPVTESRPALGGPGG